LFQIFQLGIVCGRAAGARLREDAIDTLLSAQLVAADFFEF
jgi:hypothetical protein